MSHKIPLKSGRYALATCKLTLHPNGNHNISGDDYTDFYWFTDIEVFINSTRSISLGELVNKFLAYEMKEAEEGQTEILGPVKHSDGNYYV